MGGEGWRGRPQASYFRRGSVSALVCVLEVNAVYVVNGVLEVGMLVIHAAEHDTSPGEHMYARVEVSSRGLGGESDGRAGASRVTADDCRDGVLEMSEGRLVGGGGLTSVESKSQNLGGYEPVFSEIPDVE